MSELPVSLPMWVVYDHPSDYPEHYVARLHEVGADGDRPTDETLTSPTLDPIRKKLAEYGLVRVARSEEDDPVIVETWL